jgi:hypothetical protein
MYIQESGPSVSNFRTVLVLVCRYFFLLFYKRNICFIKTLYCWVSLERNTPLLKCVFGMQGSQTQITEVLALLAILSVDPLLSYK